MAQRHLWHDGYVVLQREETGEIGKTRLNRYLHWLDKTGGNWTDPDLEAYEAFLRDKVGLRNKSVDANLVSLRQHYLAILSNPANYDFVPAEERPSFVNMILENIGFHTASVRYAYLMRDDDRVTSVNMQVLLPDASHFYRDTYLTTFIHWMDETNRHWSEPDLLMYKQYLRDRDVSGMTIKNSITAIRKRYQELRDNDDLMATLTDAQRERFTHQFRRLLGYWDAFPKKPTREMLEDDPYNHNQLSFRRQNELVDAPDVTTLMGLRDRAILGLVLVTGIQQLEVAQMEVDHLRCQEGRSGVYVPESKLKIARFVPFDGHFPVEQWLDDWLTAAEITEGAVFRGTYGNREVLRPHGIAPETASDVLTRYPVMMNGSPVPLLFTDLRATCGRRWYDVGHDLDDIERWLGVTSRSSMLSLIGLRVRELYTWGDHS